MDEVEKLLADLDAAIVALDETATLKAAIAIGKNVLINLARIATAAETIAANYSAVLVTEDETQG